MKRTSMLLLVFLTLPPDARAQTGFDGRQVEREVTSVLDAILDAFNRQDARAEERTYQFPHYRLANGLKRDISTVDRIDGLGSASRYIWKHDAFGSF